MCEVAMIEKGEKRGGIKKSITKRMENVPLKGQLECGWGVEGQAVTSRIKQ